MSEVIFNGALDWSGLDHYDRKRARVTIEGGSYIDWSSTLPDDPAPVHAYRSYRGTHEIVFLRDPTSYRAAWCGAPIKVLLPVVFDHDDPDGCDRCLEAMSEGTPRTPRWRDALD